MISRHGIQQVVGPSGRHHFVGLLRVKAGTREIAVAHARNQRIADQRERRRGAHPPLPPCGVPRSGHDRASGDLGLIDRRHRLGMARQARADHVELGRVERRQLHHRHPHGAALVHQLTAQRLGESLDRVLGGAVGALQRYAPVGQRRADLHDHAAIAIAHALEREDRPVHHAEVGDLGDAPVLLRGDLAHRREHRHHRVVDPHVDRPELALDRGGSGAHAVGIGHVGLEAQRASAVALELGGRGSQAVCAPRHDRHRRPLARERPGRGAADTRGRASDRDHPWRVVRARHPRVNLSGSNPCAAARPCRRSPNGSARDRIAGLPATGPGR